MVLNKISTGQQLITSRHLHMFSKKFLSKLIIVCETICLQFSGNLV